MKPQYDSINPRYAEVLVRDAQKSLAALDPIMKIEGAWSEDELRTYTIYVHGMKSALASIGISNLSVEALKLEMAARNSDMDTIQSDTPIFIKSLRELVDYLSADKDNQATADSSNDNLPYLIEHLQSVVTACDEFDESGIENAITKILEKPWSGQIKDLLNSISLHLLHSDFDEIKEIAETFLRKD